MLQRLAYYAVGLIILASTGIARDIGGRYESAPPDVRQWFRDQKSPKTGGLCCSEADGGEVQEDIVAGHYWVTWPEVSPRWIPVPDEVVLLGANKAGHPVVWVYYEKGEVKIRCFAPGAKG